MKKDDIILIDTDDFCKTCNAQLKTKFCVDNRTYCQPCSRTELDKWKISVKKDGDNVIIESNKLI